MNRLNLCSRNGANSSCRASRSLPVIAAACMFLVADRAGATTIYANPGDSISSKISTMNPGDTLILNPGTYNPSGTVMYINGKVGTPTAWYTIKALQPNTVKLQGNSGTNMCELHSSAYWQFQNLELDGRGLADDGIKASYTTGNIDTDACHDIILDTLDMHNLNNACVNVQVTVWNLTVQNCWLHDVGTATTPGLGAYLGNPDHNQQIINLTFRNNLIERTTGYGMQVKAQNPRTGVALGTTPGKTFTSWGWLIKDNVYMRTNPPAIANRPCLLVDAAPVSGTGSTDLATIDGNIVLAQTSDSATDDNGFQLSGNLRVINNVLMNCKGNGVSAIRIGFHDITNPMRVEVLNNTVFIDGSSNSPCLSVSSLQSGYTQVVANNAFIRGDTTAIAVSMSSIPSVVANNIVRGTGAISGMTTITTPLAQIFITPNDTPGVANLYPVVHSPLIGAGTAAVAPAVLPTNDFNGVPRSSQQPVDVGAYQLYTANNPGWQISDASKHLWVPGDINGDGTVNVSDLQALVVSWGQTTSQLGYYTTDLNGDGYVNVGDLQILVANWGKSL